MKNFVGLVVATIFLGLSCGSTFAASLDDFIIKDTTSSKYFAKGTAFFLDGNAYQAAKWYRKAADGGHQLAQIFLANQYTKGLGVPQSRAAAVRLYRAAVIQGGPMGRSAQFELGVLLSGGDGLDPDYVAAHMWFNLAGALHKDSRNKRDALARHMTSAQIAEAQKFALLCLNSNYRRCD